MLRKPPNHGSRPFVQLIPGTLQELCASGAAGETHSGSPCHLCGVTGVRWTGLESEAGPKVTAGRGGGGGGMLPGLTPEGPS